MGSDFDQTLKSVEVEVLYQQGASDSLRKCRFTVKIGFNDTFRKIKKHIMESLDTQGKMMYGKYNCDESPLKKMSDCTSGSREEKFYITTMKKPKSSSSQQLNITLQVLSQDGVKAVQKIQIAKTTTIYSLKHRIQDDHAIPVEEQTVHVLGQQKELLSGTNIMQLKEPIVLEVKWTGDAASPPVAKPKAAKPSPMRTLQQRTNGISSGTPYSTKLVPYKRRGSVDISSIHPKTLRKEKAGIPIGQWL